ncbi:MAG: hypothetical protein MZV63_19985 [Marinilabiliales bacterium]|nr:hypothetical protein [Marinilabiliales bacterium]
MTRHTSRSGQRVLMRMIFPMVITQSEFMRRMKDMAQFGGGYSFYGEMPDSYNLVLNTNHPLVISLAGALEQ